MADTVGNGVCFNIGKDGRQRERQLARLNRAVRQRWIREDVQMISERIPHVVKRYAFTLRVGNRTKNRG
jgi:hypothetical protein